MATGGHPSKPQGETSSGTHGKKRRITNISSAPMGNVGSSAGGQQGLQPQPQQPIVWTDEEDKIIRQCLELYRNYDHKKTCRKIAALLPGKSAEDVERRVNYMIDIGIHKITGSSTSHPPGKSGSDVARRHESMIVSGIDKNTELSTSHPLPMSQRNDDDAEVIGNLLHLTKAILEKVGENPQAKENVELLCGAMKNISELINLFHNGTT